LSFDLLWADRKSKKAYEELSSIVRPRVGKSIKSLSTNPRPLGCKKLSGKLEGVWRIRVGDFRVLYEIRDKTKEIVILTIGPRRQVYR